MLTLTTLALADEHIRDLRNAAARRRLTVLAACCRPATWRRAASRVAGALRSATERVRRGQLEPTETCCA